MPGRARTGACSQRAGPSPTRPPAVASRHSPVSVDGGPQDRAALVRVPRPTQRGWSNGSLGPAYQRDRPREQTATAARQYAHYGRLAKETAPWPSETDPDPAVTTACLRNALDGV